MKRTIALIISLIFVLELAGCGNKGLTFNNGDNIVPSSSPAPEIKTMEQLTLDKVIELSAKGEELTWSDFEQYESIAEGSGLIILVYEIDNNFDLMIGGGSTQLSPMYIYLVSKANQDYIDIRTENIEEFIESTE